VQLRLLPHCVCSPAQRGRTFRVFLARRRDLNTLVALSTARPLIRIASSLRSRRAMTHFTISIRNDFRFVAKMEYAAAPATCAGFRRLLPYTQRLVHCRWSGEGCWIPLGTFEIGVGPENSTSMPRPGELLWYSGNVSETELLFPYGEVAFACRAGPLTGNHFLTIVDGMEQLSEVGRRVLYHGAHDVRFSLM
jgi:hypothetical protein